MRLSAGAPVQWIHQISETEQIQELITVSRPTLPPIEESIACAVIVIVFIAFLLSHFISKHLQTTVIRQRKSCFDAIVAVFAALIGVANLLVLVLFFFAEERAVSGILIAYFIAQAITWIGICASLRMTLQRSAEIVAAVWWLVVFVTESVLAAWATWNLAAENAVSIYWIMSIISWPIAFLLLISACIRMRRQPSYVDHDSLVETLLGKSEEDTDNVTAYATAGFWSYLTFSCFDSVIEAGNLKTLEVSDIPQLPVQDRAEKNHEAFVAVWKSQREKDPAKKPSVMNTLLKCYWKELLITGILAFIRTVTVSAAPLFIYSFVNVVAGNGHFKNEGYVLIIGLTIVKFIQSLSQRHWSFRSRYAGARLRSAIIAEVYEKQLRMTTLAKQRHGAGEIVSYIGVDAYRLGDFAWWIHYTWGLVLQLALSLAILVSTIGWATVACVLVLIISVGVQIPTSRLLQKSQTNFMYAQDKRLRATTEILTSMKIIKLQSWEEEFKTLIRQHREEELKWLASMHNKRGYSFITFWFSYTVAVSGALAAYAILGNILTSAIIFTVFAAFGNTQEPVRIVPELLAIVSQVKVSLSRLDRFLQDEEIPKDAVDRESLRGSELVIKVEGGNFKWDPESEKNTLTNIHLQVKPGDKVAVCGGVGSGKSSLLQALLGEIPKQSGKVEVFGSIAYVSQSAWIQTGTIRENILFGKRFDEEKYRTILRACALETDLQILPYGDGTEIGERGLNLSGGQKQRIQLARAVYNDADIYLLDDPFSAVDAHTAATLFHDCVMKALSSKTVVLVTHQVEFLPAVDSILVIKDGEIEQSGKYDELVEAGLAFEQLVNAHREALESFNHRHLETETAVETEQTTVAEFKKSLSIRRSSSSQNKGIVTAAQQLTEKEEKGVGDLGLQPYKDYLNISKTKLLFTIDLCAQAGLVAGQVAGGLWLATQVQNPHINAKRLIGGYAIISYSTSLFFIVRVTAHMRLGVKASREFFFKLMDSLFKAPMSFFDSTPTGRILSRASNDMSLLDIDLNQISNIIIAFVFDLPSVFIVLVYVIWEYIIIVIPMLIIVWSTERYYRASAQELMRLNAMTKAPIVNFSGETVTGVTSIRAFGVTEEFKVKNLKLVNSDATLYMHNYAVMEWLVIRVETYGTIMLLIFGIMLTAFSSTSSGLAGVGLTYAMLINVSLVILTQWYCQLANVIVSVERIKQYMHIPEEAPPVIDSNRPPTDWPTKGTVVLENLQIRYRPNSPLVLRGITCRFEGGEKIGVVGRTGSGKSTLIGALFRLVEPVGGRIIIDGIDVCTIGLRDLRSKLGIIPQEPTLFRGTVRSNLDPLAKYPDSQIWEALDKCQMGREIREMGGHLDAEVSDEGGNWSAGQRQLFCLGRVLLKRSRILVLDEATASIDSNTDAVLQGVIKSEFRECTVVTVAHRIPTVIDSDRVLALADGRVAEYGSPEKLLHNPNSLFASLVAEYWAQSSGKTQ